VLTAEAATDAGRDLATDLVALNAHLSDPALARATSLAARGQLTASLSALGVEEKVARAAARWPAVLRPARRQLAVLPVIELWPQLAVLALICSGIAITQLAVAGVLSLKVLPLFAKLTHQGAALPRAALDVLVPLQIVVWVAALAYAASSRARWKTQRALADHAAIAAALIEARAPGEVVNTWLAEERGLPHSPLAEAGDLRALAGHFGGSAQRQAQRFVAALRVIALGLLVLGAVSIAQSVFTTISRIPGTVP
jgi:hypothetical protein